MSAIIGSAAVVGPEAGKILAPVAKAVGKSIAKAAPGRFRAWRQRVALRKVLGIAADDCFHYRLPSIDHPLLQLDSPHPDDLAAFSAVAGPSLIHAHRNGWLEEVDQLRLDLTQNLVTIGSPEVEPFIRLAFDYRRNLRGAGLRYVGETVKFPYRWYEDPTEIVAKCARYVPDHGLVTRPNWPLIWTDPRAAAERRLIPQVNARTGMLESDYLLITSMPNFLTPEALDSGRRFVNIAGVHGIATAAISLVLRKRKLLAEISESILPLDRTSAFQILVEVSKIEHDAGTGRSRAQAIRLLDIWTESGISFDQWATATVVVAERFSDWVLESELRNHPDPHERR